MSIRFQADNDLKFGIVKALRNSEPSIDFASAQDANLDNLSDPEVLDRAASEGRILVSHDRRTMLDHFRAHLALGKSSPGVLIVSQGVPIGQVVESLIYIWALSDPLELCDQAHYLPSISRHVFIR